MAGSQLCCAVDPHRARRRPDACPRSEALGLCIYSLHSLFTFTRSSVVFHFTLYTHSLSTSTLHFPLYNHLHTQFLHSLSKVSVVFLQKVFLLFDYCLFPAAKRNGEPGPPLIALSFQDAFSAPRRLKTRPRRSKTPPRRSKMSPRRSKTRPRRPKRPPRRAQDAPRRLQDAILVGFWSQNEAKLSQVGIKIACGSDLMLK